MFKMLFRSIPAHLQDLGSSKLVPGLAPAARSIFPAHILNYLRYIAVSIFVVGFASSALGVPCPNDSNIYKGPVYFADQKLDSLTIAGSGNLQSSEVYGKTVVFGPFDGLSCAFEKMEVTGPLNLTDSSVVEVRATGPVNLKNVQARGLLSVVGPLSAVDSDLPEILILSQEINLKDSKVGRITVNAGENPEPQRLYLGGETQVSGPIVFKRGDGIVIKTSGQVKLGQVTGATIEDASEDDADGRH